MSMEVADGYSTHESFSVSALKDDMAWGFEVYEEQQRRQCITLIYPAPVGHLCDSLLVGLQCPSPIEFLMDVISTLLALERVKHSRFQVYALGYRLSCSVQIDLPAYCLVYCFINQELMLSPLVLFPLPKDIGTI